MAGVAKTVDARPKDQVSSVLARFTSHGDARTSSPMLLMGEHWEDTTLETDRWTETTASGGSSTIATGEIVLSTSAAANGSDQIKCDHYFSPLNGTELYLRAHVRFVTDGDTAGNTREIGLTDSAGNNKVYLELSNATLSFKIDRGGSNTNGETAKPIVVDDNKYFEVEIAVSKDVCRCNINGNQFQSFNVQNHGGAASDGTGVLLESTILTPYIKNTNGASTTNNQLACNQLGLYLIGDVDRGPCRIIERNAASDAVLLRGAGIFEGFLLTATVGQQWILYDNTAASGKILARKGTLSPPEGTNFRLMFVNGLYFDHVSGSADTIQFFVRGA